MNKPTLVKSLFELNAGLSDPPENLEELLQGRCEEISNTLMCSDEDIATNMLALTGMVNCPKNTSEWKYICLNFYILQSLHTELLKSDTDILSVQEIKNIKTSLQNFMVHGIFKNLLQSMPHHVALKRQTDVIYGHSLLKCTAFGLYHCTRRSSLRMLILPHCLQGILVAFLQVGYCPLKKPSQGSRTGFVMTESLHAKLFEEQLLMKRLLEEDVVRNIHPSIFVKEIMVLFQANAPVWFKRTISNILTRMLRSKEGVKHIALAMLDGCDDDSAKTWKILDLLTKLVLSCQSFPDFQITCGQILNLLKTTDAESLIFERLIVSCTKCLYAEDKELCTAIFVDRLTTPLMKFVCKKHIFRDHDDVTDDIKQTVRLLHGCFADNSVNSACLPAILLKRNLSVVFHFYHLTVKSSLEATNKELKELLIQYLRQCTTEEIHQLFDHFLFDFTVTDIPHFRNDVIMEVDEKILVGSSPHCVIYATADVMDTVYNLLDTEQKIILFGYLLKCTTDKERYFLTPRNSKELLGDEDHATSTVIERLLAIHKLLSQLSENKDVQKSLRNKPDDIIEYIKNVLACDTTDPQMVFVVVMILDNLILNAASNVIFKYKVLMEALSVVAADSKDAELKTLCNKILVTLKENKIESPEPEKEVTELERALQDVHDPLLPTRGHGLLLLTKLIEKKDKQAMERKQYLLNLFQLYLKDDDSFIYLNAIQGLAALTNIYPDAVLESLCEEYADFSKKEGALQENRIKLGEVLLRVVKLLGDMALQYKSVLLNTFLCGTRDDDYMLRASSLSNLGELCRILNYKLGTIVTEVLECVHAIITTDKAVEARRAAVTVIRQLFVGLQSEMIAFIKEDILPIYRTLKEIYYNDKDDIMRLQAQLALEELNENMRSFVFPKPELHLEKKIVMLD